VTTEGSIAATFYSGDSGVRPRNTSRKRTSDQYVADAVTFVYLRNEMSLAVTEINSRTSGKYAGRIVALRKGEMRPLIRAPRLGPSSPSHSLLVERFDLQPSDWQTQVLPDQVLALFLKPSIVQHEWERGAPRDVPVGRGEVVVCMRRRVEAIRWKEPASVLCVRVGDEALGEAANSMLGRDRLELEPELLNGDARMLSLLHALEGERAAGYASGRLFVDSIETALAAVLVSSCSGRRSEVPPIKLVKGGLPAQRLRRVLEFMQANMAKQITLEELAKCAELSLSHFSHQFRVSTNASPYKYMLALRIRRGKKMLLNPKLSILEVSLATGFENQQHFATVFRRMVGVSPSTYRRQA